MKENSPDQPMPMFSLNLPSPFILSCSGIARERFFLNNYPLEYSDIKGWKSEEKKWHSLEYGNACEWGPSPWCKEDFQGVGADSSQETQLPLSCLSSVSRHINWPLQMECTELLSVLTSINEALDLPSEIFRKNKPKCCGRSIGWPQAHHFIGEMPLSG